MDPNNIHSVSHVLKPMVYNFDDTTSETPLIVRRANMYLHYFLILGNQSIT
jgi:hypothetical protein